MLTALRGENDMNIKPIMTRVCVLAVLMILISQNRMIIADASVSKPESGAGNAISVVMDDNYRPMCSAMRKARSRAS